jgi:3-phosphoshikimate 1-carboxyvinyltransferase
MRWLVTPSTIGGSLAMPGDKSIAHRALMLAGLAEGVSSIDNLPAGEDVRSTARCIGSLGVTIDDTGNSAVVRSTGDLEAPEQALDAANSGTSMRLLTGILAGQGFDSCLVGDDLLSRRPMGRVIEPLAHMGARIGSRDGRAPLEIHGSPLTGIHYTLPVASAQVKSAILLAGLFASGETTVEERAPSRDHTERMLRALGVEVHQVKNEVTVVRGKPTTLHIRVPGDPSSAAFFFAAAALTGGKIEVTDVSVNPTRVGFLRAMDRMGISVEMGQEHLEMGEPVASVRLTGAVTKPITIGGDEVPQLVDEISLLALLATQAPGRSVITGAGELRVKETDRIAAVSRMLGAMGAEIRELPDGFVVDGPTRLLGRTVSSGGDHRLAMLASVAGSSAQGETIVESADAAAVSFPAFDAAFAGVGGRIEVD